MSDPSSSSPDDTNAATGVDKAMKQFSQTDAERARPSADDSDKTDDKDTDTADAKAGSEIQPPRSDAPADESSAPKR